MTEQEMADSSQGPRVSMIATSGWIRWGPCNLAQSRCTNVCWLAEKVKDKVTAECSEGEGMGQR